MPQAIKLANFVASYIRCDVKIFNVIRTAFDEIEAVQRGGRFLKPNGSAYWLNKSDLLKASLRPLLLEDFKYRSPDAHSILDNAGRSDDLDDDIELVCEHVIPCAVMEKLLKDQHVKKELTPDDVLSFHSEMYHRCIITKDEDGKLSRSSMPSGWTRGDQIFARYSAAGFEWASNYP